MATTEHSRITGRATVPLFTASVLGRYDVQYYQCAETGFIQTETPYWLDEAYSTAITALDIGLLNRNLLLRRVTATIVDRQFDTAGTFIDYGGGYGIFTRLMRDWGFDFKSYDPICQNLFAKDFAVQLPGDGNARFELLTAWELFEHLVDPPIEVEKMFALSDSILFSTELVPAQQIDSVDDWWYFIPETGQHVSLYTKASLAQLAARFDAKYFTDGYALHLFSRTPGIRNPFAGKLLRTLRYVLYTLKRRWHHSPSLLPTDFAAIRNRMATQPPA